MLRSKPPTSWQARSIAAQREHVLPRDLREKEDATRLELDREARSRAAVEALHHKDAKRQSNKINSAGR